MYIELYLLATAFCVAGAAAAKLHAVDVAIICVTMAFLIIIVNATAKICDTIEKCFKKKE